MNYLLKNFQAILNRHKFPGEMFADEYDLIYAACEIVAKRKKIKLVRPPLLAQTGDLFDFIEKIAESSDVRIRKISFSGEWWKKDAGALIGFYQNEPCVLLPKKIGGYQLVDIKRGRRIVVSGRIAAQLSPQGFYLYSPLPVNIRRMKDLFSLSLAEVKNDFGLFATAQIFLSFFTLVVPVSLGYLFNVVIPNVDLPLLWEVMIVLFINAWVITLFNTAQTATLIRIRFKLEAMMGPAIWDRILKFPLRFFRRFSAGDLLFRANVISDIQNSVTRFSLLTVGNSFTLMLTVILLFYYSPVLAGVTLVLALIIVLIALLINFRQLLFMRRLYYHFGQFIGFVLEIILGISKIRITNATSRIFDLWVERLAKRSHSELHMKFHQLGLEVLIAFMTVGNPLVLYALVQGLNRQLSFGDFVAFNAAYTLFFVTLFRMTSVLSDTWRIVPLWKKSRTVLTAKIEREISHADPGELTGDIVMKNIVFRYHTNDQPLFKDFSLSIRAGEFIAVVGPSGSGKSTLFRLLLGFEEPEAGEIYYNGINLKTLRLAAVRRQIGVVIQNSTLIPGTIFANIAGNSMQMSRLEAWEIAEKVGLGEFIKYLPMQMDTLITEGAITLSGGEAQRLILARALAQKPKILVLDEATSALDNTTQAIVHNYLKQLQATQIIAAHRLSTIVNADRIVVIDKGLIVQSGTFAELMSHPGLFAQMARRQF